MAIRSAKIDQKAGLIWAIADKLTGPYKPHEYGDVILPLYEDLIVSCLIQRMPKITPHVCRHTFCSNMAKSGMTPKTLQYIMGHSDIGVTLNTYTHLIFDDAKEEMERLSKAQ
ncbi:tyrosine-type recombinase/integrase [Lachnospiraceae bacterium C1.1]|nr:tyrosine-type recombinase/integrase [Lachnospiraceae bacterium C1.1]